MARLKMAHGNWVEGDRFWGREIDLNIFMSRIDEGAQQQLTAQRRMGKTSLMRETARRLHNRYHCLFVDLQKASAAPDAIVELSLAVHPYQSLWNQVAGVFGNVFAAFRDHVENVNLGEVGISLRAGLAGDWQQKGDQLMAVLADADLPVLILIDEAPILITVCSRVPTTALLPIGGPTQTCFFPGYVITVSATRETFASFSRGVLGSSRSSARDD